MSQLESNAQSPGKHFHLRLQRLAIPPFASAARSWLLTPGRAHHGLSHTSTSGIHIMAVKQSVLYLSVGVLPGSRPPSHELCQSLLHLSSLPAFPLGLRFATSRDLSLVKNKSISPPAVLEKSLPPLHLLLYPLRACPRSAQRLVPARAARGVTPTTYNRGGLAEFI